MELSGQALSTCVYERLKRPGVFPVQARFAHVLNLTDGRDFLSVQDESVPWTPLSLVLKQADFQLFCRLAQGELTSGGGGLASAAVTLTTSAARRFSCRMETCSAPGAERRRLLRSGAALLARRGSLAYAGDPRLAAWAGGETTEAQRMARALLDGGRPWALAGLGAGLTPAGDDFLVGLLAALTAWGEEDSRRELAHQIAAGLDQTTALSGAFLRHALAGDFSLPVLALVRALSEEEEDPLPALAALCAVGHSSGSDLLGGILYGLQYGRDTLDHEE